MATTYEEEKKKAVDSIRQSMPQSGVIVNDYSDYIKEYHKAQEDAAIADIENAYKKNTATLDRAAKGIPVQYEGARNQAAGNAARTQRNNDLYAAAAGLGSGTGAQARLATGVALQNNLNDINRAEASAKADIELQRTQLATDYENAIAKAKANGNATLADALYREYVRADESLVAQSQYRQNMALDINRLAETLAQNQWARQTADQQYRDNLILAQEQAKLAADKYADQLEQQKWENWYREQTLNTEREIAGLPVLTTPETGNIIPDPDAPPVAPPDAEPIVTDGLSTQRIKTSTGAVLPSEWEQAQNQVRQILRTGNPDALNSYIMQIVPKMSKQQAEEIEAMINNAGFQTM